MILLAPLATTVVLAVVVARLSHALPARFAFMTTLTAAVCGALATVPVLFHFSMTWFVDIPRVGPALHDALHDGGIHVSGRGVFDTAAVGLLMVAGWRAYARIRSRRVIRRAHPGGLVITNDTDLYAFAVSGRRSGIVVSKGVFSELSQTETRVVLAHELEHLQGGHDRFLTIGALCEFVNPLLRWPVASLHFALERLADEAAARAVGNRVVVADTIARVALGGNRSGAAPRVDAFLGMASHGVVARIEAISAPQRSPSLAVVATAISSIAAVVSMALLQWHHVAHTVAIVCG